MWFTSHCYINDGCYLSTSLEPQSKSVLCYFPPPWSNRAAQIRRIGWDRTLREDLDSTCGPGLDGCLTTLLLVLSVDGYSGEVKAIDKKGVPKNKSAFCVRLLLVFFFVSPWTFQREDLTCGLRLFLCGGLWCLDTHRYRVVPLYTRT